MTSSDVTPPEEQAPAQQGTARTDMSRSGLVVSFLTFLSRILGLVRDLVIATLFGDSDAADTFFVAFKIPNFLRRLFAEGAFSQAFVPVLSEYRKKRTLAEVRLFIDHVFGRLGLILLLVTVVGVAGAAVLASLFGFGYTDEAAKFDLLVSLLRITFPYILLISLTGFAGSVLNSYGNFSVPALTPIWLNLSLISCAILVSPLMEEPVMALAWGVVLAGLIQLMFQLPFLGHLKLIPRPRISGNHEGVSRVIRLMVPVLFSVSVSQINLLLDTVLATTQVSGSVSWLYYADRLMELPLGIFGVAIATVILPGLSRIHAGEDQTSFNLTLNWALRCIVLLGLPAVAGLFMLAKPLIFTLFQHGEFAVEAVNPTVYALQAYCIGLLGFMAIKVLASAYFARQDTATPVRYGIIAMVVNMALNLALIVPLAHVGLALATSVAACLNCSLLLGGLIRRGVLSFTKEWVAFLLKVVLALVLMILALWLLLPDPELWENWSVLQRTLQLLLLVGVGGVVYFVILFFSGMRVRDFLHSTDV